MEQKNELKDFYDLTLPISSNLVMFPGDPAFSKDIICSLERGHKYNLCHMHLGNHTGTHVDFPEHIVQGGKNSSNFTAQYLQGPGVIIKLPSEERVVTRDFVAKQSILKNDIVFFKTANSQKLKDKPFTETYVYIEPDAAEELLRKEVKIVGIDYISVDRYEDENLTVHNKLLPKEVLIVEGLDLSTIPEGRYQILIMPLKVLDMDGLPARVVAFNV